LYVADDLLRKLAAVVREAVGETGSERSPNTCDGVCRVTAGDVSAMGSKLLRGSFMYFRYARDQYARVAESSGHLLQALVDTILTYLHF